MVKQWFTHNGRICGGPAADRLGLPGWEPGFSGAGRRCPRCSLDHQRSRHVPVDRAVERVADRFGWRREAGGPANGDADVKSTVGGCDGVALAVLVLDGDLLTRSNRCGDLEREVLGGDEDRLRRRGNSWSSTCLPKLTWPTSTVVRTWWTWCWLLGARLGLRYGWVGGDVRGTRAMG